MISVELYFGDTYIEDAHDVTWHVIQQQQPLFGYNSYIFDEIALGSRIIQGEFMINFTGAGVVDRLIEAAKHTTTLASSYKIQKTQEEYIPTEHVNTGVVSTEDEKAPIWQPIFDLDIVCQGDPKGGKPAHLIIEDINVSRCSTSVSAQGGVLMQRYSFIGRNMRNVD